ncbi:hypothetical protein IFM89_039370 [Coptis chinensis]|uniref:Sulfhydryl oxidase n=1 Tax=Coptis chinensis TaxID=261450 RepID=A0A835IIV9_9MAGN|nr:hypothetical protein IFM89_039370 [Coptis chinensis]
MSSVNQNPMNPIQLIFRTYQNLAQCIQTHVSHFLADSHPPSSSSDSLSNHHRPFFSFSSLPSSTTSSGDQSLIEFPQEKSLIKVQLAKPVSKEELGRATWTFLHTLAAQFPDRPTRQQKKDVKELMAILSRFYPCKECADHFKEVLSANPVQAGSQSEFSQWLCHVHNVVNRSLGKLVFPCQRVDARWGKLECRERACDLEGSSTEYRNR